MAFQSLQARTNTLPTILVGPIVRRVQTKTTSAIQGVTLADPAGVSIWLVMKELRTVGLQIYEDDGTTPVGSLAHGFPNQIGDNLYVVLITSNQELDYSKRYYYDLIFGAVNSTSYVFAGTADAGLFDPGILSDETDIAKRRAVICYGNNQRPFFHTPRFIPGSQTSVLDEVSIAHASCRKPHGGDHSIEVDAMSHLNDIFEENESGTGSHDLPQQLFLTGDQIYADDVDASLMYLIQDAIPYLYSSSYDPRARFFNDIPKEWFDLGERQKTVVQHAGFTSEDHYGQDHLIHESEFYIMYLFAWSDVLWPAEVPPFASAVQALGLDFNDYFDLDDENVPIGSKEAGRYRRDPRYQFVQDVYGSTGKAYKLKKSYESKLNHVETFRKTVAKFRRVVANVATYMMFDDHDVTDDWFLNYGQTRRVLGESGTGHTGKDLGKYITSNGLMAFALFQAWGNKPDYFSGNMPGGLLISNIVNWYSNVVSGGAAGSLGSLRSDIASQILPTIQPGTIFTYNNSGGKCLKSGVDWNYYFDCGSYRVVVLDSRTRRGFRNDTKAAAGLLSSEAVRDQLPPPSSYSSLKPTVLIAPAPLLGAHSVEFTQGNMKTFLGEAVADYEAFGNHALCWDAVCYALMNAEQLVVLSGDVHYGFAIRGRVWDFSSDTQYSYFPNFPPDYRQTTAPKNPAQPHTFVRRELNAIQLVSSSSKNSASGVSGSKTARKTEWISHNEVDLLMSDDRTSLVRMNPPGPMGLQDYPPSEFGDLWDTKSGVFRNPDREFSSSHFPARQYSLLMFQNDYTEDEYKKMVGVNNVGLVQFYYQGPDLGVQQKLYFTQKAGGSRKEANYRATFSSAFTLPYTGHD